MKKTVALALLSSLLVSACASQPHGLHRPLKLSANPSALLAQEIAMEQLGQEKGRSAGLREYAASDAIMFAPQLVPAQEWLKDAKLPPVNREVHKVIMSCDGKTGVTTGAWIASGELHGYFTTVWQRYEKRDGSGKWLWTLTHDDRLDKPLKAPDFIQTQTASCKGRAPASISAPAEGVRMKQGLSRDQSLSWTWQYRPDQSRMLEIKIWDGEKTVPVLTNNVAAPGK